MLDSILQFLVVSITEGSIYALMGLGLVIIFRTTEVLFFAQGTIAMASGVTLYALSTYYGNIPFVVAVSISLMVSVIIALASEWLVILPLLDRGASPFSVSIVTIGVVLILETSAMVLFGKDPLAVPPFSGDKPIHFFGARIVLQEIWIVGTMAGFCLLVLLFFKKTWAGKAMAAVGNNSLLAKALGIPVRRIFSYSFLLGSLIGGSAGVISAPISYTGYWIGLHLVIKGFIAAAVGGIKNPVGTVMAGIIMGLFESFGAGFISSGYKDLITIILLLLVLRWRPQGLMAGRSL